VTASTCRKTWRSPSSSDIIRIFGQFHAVTALRFVPACHVYDKKNKKLK
jgi:hypothetical protein